MFFSAKSILLPRSAENLKSKGIEPLENKLKNIKFIAPTDELNLTLFTGAVSVTY
jgi:hypothetical protein